MFVLLAVLLAAAPPPRTILAIGAHAGDMELTCGALLLKETQRGDRVVILHLTLGEAGNPKMTAAQYGEQKKSEATAAAAALGAEVMFGPYKDGELPDDQNARRYVADVIRQVKPTMVITHWRNSMHKDHATASAVTRDAVLLASIGDEPWRGVRAVWFADNWEDAEGFQPYIFVDVTGALAQWREAVSKYAFVRGGISPFPYLNYYTALATVRGAIAGKESAVAFDIEAYGKKRVLDNLP
jgi:LmbE family N-acetylglucosaminyl deacetylase